MFQIAILSTVTTFAKEFERCCREFEKLQFATAWCGSPKLVLPYEHIQTFTGKISGIVGRSFNQTHPDAIECLVKKNVDLRVFREEKGLFHPKLYLFSSGAKIALFIGSSNLTFNGFCSNFEANVLVEGIPNPAETAQIQNLRRQLNLWRSDAYSFCPDDKWIASYRLEFSKTLQSQRQCKLNTPLLHENDIGPASWLTRASWQTYYNRILRGLAKNRHKASDYFEVLDEARQALQIPWKPAYFDELQIRKLIGGMKPYGSLGHVAASGKFRKLVAGGTAKQKQVIVDVMNETALLKIPVDWDRVGSLLQSLVKLGPTMKVWSRVLCIARPDLFCTVSSTSVRTNLAQTLKVSQSSFESPKGYIALLKLIHAAPWMQSTKPINKREMRVWTNRAAFMDAIFYSDIAP